MENYQHRDYLRIIITGLIYHHDYLAKYLKRKQKKAAEDHIEFSEFIGRTITVVEDLEGQLRQWKDKKINELEAKKDGTNDYNINEQIDNLTITEGFTLPLELYTAGEFKGNLGFWDISRIRDAINEAFDFYSFESDHEKKEPINYFQNNYKVKAVEEVDSTIEPKNNPHPEVFKSLEGFILFQRLYDSNKNSRTLLADFSFIYRRMYQDDLLHDHQTPEVFRRWLSNEPFEIVLDNYLKTLDNCYTHDKEVRYHDAKTLVRNQIN